MAKGRARDLFNDGDGDGDGCGEARIVVNKAYADRFEHNKRREALHRLQELEKRGMASSEDDSESEEEDDDGILPVKTEAKILETLVKIKSKDPSIYADSTKFFDEGDEDGDGDGEETEKERESVKKPVYLKDAMAKQLLEDGPEMAEDEDEKKPKKKGKTYLEEQEGLKQAFLREAAAAMEIIDGKEGRKKDKKKNRKKDGDEDEDGEEDDEESGGLLQLRKCTISDGEIPLIGNRKEDGKGEGEDDSVIVKRLEEYFGVDNGLDESEKFLKNFLLNKGWVDPESNRIPSYEDIIGDEEELLRQEKFEADYNFRFEEGPSSHVVAGYSRRIEDSVRKKPDARKKQRLSKKERMEEEELERREELKRLKNIKKSELLEKLERIRTIAGARVEDSNPLTVIAEEDLEEDFDPEEYDRKMKEAFGEEYYAAEDVDAHFGEALEEDLEKPDFDKEDELLGLPKDSDLLSGLGEALGFSSVRQKLKAACKSGIGEEEEEEDINDDSDSVQEQQSSDDEVDNTPHRKKSSSKRKKKGRISLREKLALDKELEEYYKLDYEDTIDGMPTRFKYRPVTANSYGLSAEQILKLTDAELNQYVSVKKLAPYRTEEWVPRKRHYFNNTQTHPIVLSQKKRKKRALQITPLEKKSTESSKDDSVKLNGTTNETMDIDEEKSSKKKRKRRKKGLGMSQERLIAYGKITLSKK